MNTNEVGVILLKQYDGKKISFDNLEKVIKVDDYDKLYKIIDALTESGIIKPIKNSGSNGMFPPLHKQFRVKKEIENFDVDYQEIKQLDKAFDVDFYIDNPKEYIGKKEYIIVLDQFLKEGKERLIFPASVNERSFQIFQREKLIREECVAVLNRNPKVKEALNMYYTPEPYFYIRTKTVEKEIENFLIIENKDTWYTLKKMGLEESLVINDTEIHYLILGEGNKITRRTEGFTSFIQEQGIKMNSRFYYFGDLDYEGIRIFESFKKNNDMIWICPMISLYIKMLELAKDIQLPPMETNQRGKNEKKKIKEVFYNQFDEDTVHQMKEILESDKYIPQEIISYEEWEKINGRKECN